MFSVVILWMLWTILLGAIVGEGKYDGITKDFIIHLFITIISFILFVFLTIKISETIQFTGAQKYLNKEIVIDNFEVQYNSQNQPVDTTYTFKYSK